MLTPIGKTLIDLDRVVCVTQGNEIVLEGQSGRVVLSREDADELREHYRRPAISQEALTDLGRLAPQSDLGRAPD